MSGKYYKYSMCLVITRYYNSQQTQLKHFKQLNLLDTYFIRLTTNV